VRIRNI